MSVELKPGMRLRSAVCATEVVVIQSLQSPLDVRCGGVALHAFGDDTAPASPIPPFDTGSVIGKRYVDAEGVVELLCTKAGDGSLSVGDVPLEIKQAKPLPSSD